MRIKITDLKTLLGYQPNNAISRVEWEEHILERLKHEVPPMSALSEIERCRLLAICSRREA